ncbi:hypothetical protein [Hymenobacter jeollabukensis]|uniref:Uncharacterized protein n=1 Tax=Hymenobacter jeollabukensis TaxID=2025313 RepID=A0A5R8WIZ6_9BACT|nr:hypothetical protein [Hymenobacter jeollabukensis]TLM88865.1 hypothetical protein FDY95_22040 [Hymenobacter jeollabukensis]
MCPTPDPEEEPTVPSHNITDKELDRDLINLHLPEPDSYIGTEAELRKLYGSEEYDRMMEGFKNL